MKENIVSFQVAKLAKEKGFKFPTNCFYFEDGVFHQYILRDTYGYYGDEYSISIEDLFENWNDNFKTSKGEKTDRCFGCHGSNYLETFSAPTQSLLQKWIREVHNILLYVYPYKDYAANVNDPFVWRSSYTAHKEFNTYEEALEAGLLEALKLIK